MAIFYKSESLLGTGVPTWVHGRGLYPLQPPVSLPAARRAQRVNSTSALYSRFGMVLAFLTKEHCEASDY